MEVGGVGGDLPDVTLVYADQHVFRFYVSVDDLTLAVQIVETL